METSELKTNFHSLINRFQDTSVLAHFYTLMTNINESKNGRLWNALSKEEQDELVVAELESLDEKQLISNNDMKHKHRKWL